MKTVDSNSDDLIERLTKENEFLIKLVDTIPAKMYFDQEIQDKIAAEKHLIMDKTAQSLKRKFVDLPELSSKNKHKRSRLDPLCQKSVSQIYSELCKVKQRKKKKSNNAPSIALARASNIEELQKRLHEKINSFQAKRNSENAVKKKRLNKKLKKRKENTKKVQKTEKMQKNLEVKVKKEPIKKVPKPVYNEEGKILYSKFDFSEDGVEDKKKSEFSGKDYKNLLKKAEKKKEKIEKLKEKDSEKANTVLEKEKWKKAIQKAEGMKVKDDPLLLKKSLKKEEKLKKKKVKVWKDRTEQTEKKQKQRQEKRMKNIEARKKDKLEHKIKRAKKKGRIITGL